MLNVNYIMEVYCKSTSDLIRKQNCVIAVQWRNPLKINIHTVIVQKMNDHIGPQECPHRNNLFRLFSHICACHFKWGKKQPCLNRAYILTGMSATSLGTLSKKRTWRHKIEIRRNFGRETQSCNPELWTSAATCIPFIQHFVAVKLTRD